LGLFPGAGEEARQVADADDGGEPGKYLAPAPRPLKVGKAGGKVNKVPGVGWNDGFINIPYPIALDPIKS